MGWKVKLLLQIEKMNRRLKKMSGNLDAGKAVLEEINVRTNEAAADVVTLRTLLEQALNRTDMTDAEEQELLTKAREVLANTGGLADALRALASTTPPSA